jgi:hypothetical protein
MADLKKVPYRVLLEPIAIKVADRVKDCLRGEIVELDPDKPGTLSMLASGTIELADSDVALPTIAEIQPPVGNEGGDQGGGEVEKLAINTATDEQLRALKYVGKSIAARIREAAPIVSWEQFAEVSGLRPEQIEELKQVVVLE